jgi:hypothetical protein
LRGRPICISATGLGDRVSVVTARQQRPQRYGNLSAAPLRLALVSSSCASILSGPSKITPSAPDKLVSLRQSLGDRLSSARSPNTSGRYVTLPLGKTTYQGTFVGRLSSVGTIHTLLELSKESHRPTGHQPCLGAGIGEVPACSKLPIHDLLCILALLTQLLTLPHFFQTS